MLVVRKIYDFAQAEPERVAIIADLQPITYRAFAGRIAAMRRRFSNLRQGGVALLLIDDLPRAWAVDLALRSLGHTTVSIRAADDLAGLGGLDLVALVTLAPERHDLTVKALSPSAAHVVLQDRDFDADEGDQPSLDVEPGDHILLTSGTTGRYKMILHPDAADVRAYDAVRPLREQLHQAFGEWVPLCLFRFGLWTAAGYGAAIIAWSWGGQVVFQRGPLHLAMTVPRLAHAMATPQFLAEVMAAPKGSFPRQDQMQLSVVAGQLSKALYQQVRERLTNQVVTSVAATEAGSWASRLVKDENELRWYRLTPGREVQVVGEDGQPLPTGQLGEVRVKTETSGYLHDEPATARFFRDGWFYPGDLGVLDADGRLALMGRVTDVLNVQGDKHPAAPIEQALEEALAVSAVCAFSEPGTGLAEELHVAIETDEPIDEERLAALVRSQVKGFAVTHFHFVERLPRNDMGKIERLKLRRQLLARK